MSGIAGRSSRSETASYEHHAAARTQGEGAHVNDDQGIRPGQDLLPEADGRSVTWEGVSSRASASLDTRWCRICLIIFLVVTGHDEVLMLI